MKTIYKHGDRVYDWQMGWGTVLGIDKNIKRNWDECEREYCLVIKLDADIYNTGGCVYSTEDGRGDIRDKFPRWSFAEYDLINGGFNVKK